MKARVTVKLAERLMDKLEDFEIEALRVGDDLYVHRLQYLRDGKISESKTDWVISHECGMNFGLYFSTKKNAIAFAEKFNELRDASPNARVDDGKPTKEFYATFLATKSRQDERNEK